MGFFGLKKKPVKTREESNQEKKRTISRRDWIPEVTRNTSEWGRRSGGARVRSGNTSYSNDKKEVKGLLGRQ